MPDEKKAAPKKPKKAKTPSFERPMRVEIINPVPEEGWAGAKSDPPRSEWTPGTIITAEKPLAFEIVRRGFARRVRRNPRNPLARPPGAQVRESLGLKPKPGQE